MFISISFRNQASKLCAIFHQSQLHLLQKENAFNMHYPDKKKKIVYSFAR